MIFQKIPITISGKQTDAVLELYLLDTPVEKLKIKKRPIVVICPGGGYHMTSYREGEPIAMHFLSRGYHAAVLRYSVAPARFPAALLELGAVMRMIHENQEDWYVNAEQIFVQGSSAGAHLAGTLGVFWNRQVMAERLNVKAEILRPAGLILSYPVVTAEKSYAHRPSFEFLLGNEYEEYKHALSLEEQVSEAVPPCFIWHTCEDGTVPVENSLALASALIKAGVPVELHIFPEGEHGLSLASRLVEREDGSGVKKECMCWIELADAWLERLCDKCNETMS